MITPEEHALNVAAAKRFAAAAPPATPEQIAAVCALFPPLTPEELREAADRSRRRPKDSSI